MGSFSCAINLEHISCTELAKTADSEALLLSLGANTFGFEETAEAIVALLDGLPAKDVVMVGYSLGARLALYLAENHGHRLRTVVSISGSTGIKGIHLALSMQCNAVVGLATRINVVHIICCFV